MKKLEKIKKENNEQSVNYLKDNYWFKMMKNLVKYYDKNVPDSIQIRAAAIIEKLGIPSGFYSSLEPGADKNKDKIIAKYLTNVPGVFINKRRHIISYDFRDMYPDGLPEELKKVLDLKVLKIMETEYWHRDEIHSRHEGSEDPDNLDAPIRYIRLPNGVDLFSKGYAHEQYWQMNHGEFLKEMNKYANLIVIEGMFDIPFGESLDVHWEERGGDYSELMRQATDNGFDGYFVEIDPRDETKISMERKDSFHLAEIHPFIDKYFEYLKRENPSLIKIIKTPEILSQMFRLYNSLDQARYLKTLIKDEKLFLVHPYYTKDGERTLDPTFLEMGQMMCSDAVMAIRLLLIGKLMADGHIEKGPIIDYEGSGHIDSKTFFLQYPQYAMEIILRTIGELMAPEIKKEDEIDEINKILDNPDWTKIIKQLVKMIFKKVESDPQKTTEPGLNQKKLITVPMDYLKLYNLDAKTMMPKDEDIEKIQTAYKQIQDKKVDKE